MQVLVVEPGYPASVKEIDGTLESIRETAGGRIQAIYLTEDVTLVFNEEGYVLHLPPNRGVRDEAGEFLDIIHGTFFLCGAPEDSNYFTSLPDAQIQRYSKIFATPKVFLNLGGTCHHSAAQEKRLTEGEGHKKDGERADALSPSF